MTDYHIRHDYRINHSAGESLYKDNWENSKEYQFWVYHEAKLLAEPGCSILDLGCGYGWKLRYWIKDVCPYITGVDLPEVVEYCNQNHQFGNWFSADLSLPPARGWTHNPGFDLIICADVIEHLSNPDSILEWVRKFSHDGTVVIFSTPNRDVLQGPDSKGPPSNPSHYREWGWDEFESYLRASGFTIMSHVPVPAKKDPRDLPVSQMIVAVP